MGTKIGKVLVFANVFLSIGLLAWAVSIYTNRVAYFDSKDGDTNVPGQFAQYTAEIKRLTDGSQLAQGGYQRSMDALVTMEQDRSYRNFFLSLLATEVRNRGNAAAVFRIIDRHPDALLKGLIDINKYKVIVDGAGAVDLTATLRQFAPAKDLNNKDLSGFGRLAQAMTNLRKEEADKVAQIAKLRKDTNALSLEINNPDTKTGLQPEVFKMKTIFQNLGDEDLFLADAQVNWEEQLRTLKIRKQQLTTRLAEVAKPATTDKGGE